MTTDTTTLDLLTGRHANGDAALKALNEVAIPPAIKQLNELVRPWQVKASEQLTGIRFLTSLSIT